MTELTGLLGLAVGPLGDVEVDLLPARGLGLVGLLEAGPHEGGADVRVGYVGHPRGTPERHRCRRRARHLCFVARDVEDSVGIDRLCVRLLEGFGNVSIKKLPFHVSLKIIIHFFIIYIFLYNHIFHRDIDAFLSLI